MRFLLNDRCQLGSCACVCGYLCADLSVCPSLAGDPPALRGCGGCESPSLPINGCVSAELTAAAFSLLFGFLEQFWRA